MDNFIYCFLRLQFWFLLVKPQKNVFYFVQLFTVWTSTLLLLEKTTQNRHLCLGERSDFSKTMKLPNRAKFWTAQMHAFIQSREVNIHTTALIKTILSFLQHKGIFLFRLVLWRCGLPLCVWGCAKQQLQVHKKARAGPDPGGEWGRNQIIA